MKLSAEHQRESETLLSGLSEAVTVQSARGWVEALEAARAADAFAVLLRDADLAGRTLRSAGFPDFAAWVRGSRAWADQLHRPLISRTWGSEILYAIWRAFERDLSLALRRARADRRVPRDGGVLCFVSGIDRCIVIRYTTAYEAPSLEVVDVIDSPKAAFDLFTSIEEASPRSRNTLKTLLASGHRLVYHRGILAHVDRREEPTVFGPSIDTLLLAEVLAHDVYEVPALAGRIGDVLEIGSGSGFLTAGAARHLPDLVSLTALDVNLEAAVCTEKNVRLNLGPSVRGEPPATAFIAARFAPELLGRRYDLIICNPPYIPEPPSGISPAGRDYAIAVGGLTLLQDVVGNAGRLLKPDGRMLVMVNNMALSTASAAVADGFGVRFPFEEAGFEVLFEVEAVFNHPAWLRHLELEGQLRAQGNSYRHVLHPFWLMRR